MNKAEVYIIVLNYNGWKDTIECVRSILALDCPLVKIVIVDNASTDESYEKLQQLKSEKLVLLRSNCNLGYAGGNKIGIKYAIEHKAAYICVINNDTIVDEGFLKSSIELLSSTEEFAIVSPAILEWRGDIVQCAGGRISLPKGCHYSDYMGAPYEIIKQNHLIESQFISGCCMIFKASLVDKIGYLPEAHSSSAAALKWM